jgi:hypothetical protein
MLVGMGMHHTICVPVLVGVYMRMDVRVRVVVLDLTCHRIPPEIGFSGWPAMTAAMSRGKAVSTCC